MCARTLVGKSRPGLGLAAPPWKEDCLFGSGARRLFQAYEI